jgi:subtilisin-like proprotein convertase family protein
MKKTSFICGLIVLSLAGAAHATIEFGGDWTVNTAIPDGSPVGITASQTFSDPFNGNITAVNVDLNITGGFNGDLYGYLAYQDANGNIATEILLNRLGTSASNPFGSSGSGLNVILSDTGTVNGSIHNATGNPVVGTWLPDSSSTLNGTFGGMAADGTWTLFLADMSVGGGTETLQSWGLDITAVPEPAHTGLLAVSTCMLALVGRAIWDLRRRQKLSRREPNSK